MAVFHVPPSARLPQQCVSSAHNIHFHSHFVPQRSAAAAFQRRRAPRCVARGPSARLSGKSLAAYPWNRLQMRGWMPLL